MIGGVAMAKTGRKATDWIIVEEGKPNLNELSASVSEALLLIVEWIRQQQGGNDKVLQQDADS
jgi:hypothetical protein